MFWATEKCAFVRRCSRTNNFDDGFRTQGHIYRPCNRMYGKQVRFVSFKDMIGVVTIGWLIKSTG